MVFSLAVKRPKVRRAVDVFLVLPVLDARRRILDILKCAGLALDVSAIYLRRDWLVVTRATDVITKALIRPWMKLW